MPLPISISRSRTVNLLMGSLMIWLSANHHACTCALSDRAVLVPHGRLDAMKSAGLPYHKLRPCETVLGEPQVAGPKGRSVPGRQVKNCRVCNSPLTLSMSTPGLSACSSDMVILRFAMMSCRFSPARIGYRR